MNSAVARASADVASPCVNVCRMDAASEDGALCIGCFRTLDEIACWSQAAKADKLAILAAVAKRRDRHDFDRRDLQEDYQSVAAGD